MRLSRSFTVSALFLFTLVSLMLTGCTDGFFVEKDHAADRPTDSREAAPVSERSTKLRHPQLLEQAMVQTAAGKSAGEGDVHLFIAFNEYEADGITQRVLDEFGITLRILDEYGITRRVLGEFGITQRVLDEFGITQRVLDEFGGLTMDLLVAYGITQRILDEFGVTQEQLEALMASFERDFRLKVRIDGVLPGIFVSFGSDLLDEFLLAIVNDFDIAFVEPDPGIDLVPLARWDDGVNSNQVVPWNIDRVGGSLGSLDEDVHVYLLDSGIYDNDLNVVEQKDFTKLFTSRDQETWDDSAIMEMPYYDPGDDGNPADETGHGTHIAGTIGAENDTDGVRGVAPGVQLHSLKVLTAQGRTDITTVMAALDYVMVQKLQNPNTPMIVNLSLGMDIESSAYNVLDEAVARATQNGVVVVVSAGNSGVDASTYSPAHVAEAITVGAYDRGDGFTSYSNYGSAVDILAPGDEVVSLSHLEGEEDDLILMSGTSMATGHVTGVAALFLAQNPHASPAQVLTALIESGQPGIGGVSSGTTDKTVHAGSLSEINVPPFFQYAVYSNSALTLKDALYVGVEGGAQQNANVFSNGTLTVQGSDNLVEGFGYYAGSASGDASTFQPRFNPSDLPTTLQTAKIALPSFNPLDYSGVATQVTDGNLDLNGHYDLGTREHPTIWLVTGNMQTKGDVSFSGYGVFLVAGKIDIKHSMTTDANIDEVTLGLYSSDKISFKKDNVNVAAQLLAVGKVTLKRNTTIYGSIISGDKVTFSGSTQIYYRPISSVLTDPIWGTGADDLPPPPPPPPTETFLDFTKAEWKSNQAKIKLEGRSDEGTVVSFYNATTNDFIGTATTDSKGKFKLQIQNFSPAPCTVRAEAGNTTREKEVKNAAADCQ